MTKRVGPRRRTKAAIARENGKKGGRPEKERRPLRLSAPPADALEMPGWFIRAIAKQTHEVATDPEITDKERRDYMIKAARAVSALMPRERLKQAEDALNEDADQMDAAVDPELEDAAEGT